MKNKNEELLSIINNDFLKNEHREFIDQFLRLCVMMIVSTLYSQT